MDTSIPYESTGRIEQKGRTRRHLIAAARELLASGAVPTVEQAASAAAVSRTTAYRYFPNQRSLLLAAYPEIEMPSLLGTRPPKDPEVRLDRAVKAITSLILKSEPEYRTMLRLSLQPDSGSHDRLVLRQGRAIGWLEETLAPLRDSMPEAALRRLVLAIRASCGIEALVWLTDIGGLSRDEAVEVMRWSAQALFRAAVAETNPHPAAAPNAR